MRIMHIIEATNAGVARHVFDLCGELLAAGDQVDLAYSRLRLDEMNRDRLNLLKHHPDFRSFPCDMRRSPHPSDLAALATIRRHFRQQGKPDLIHGHSTKGGAMARMLGATSRLPVVYTPNAVRSMDPQLNVLARIAIDRIEGFQSCFTTHTIAVSPEEKEYLVTRIGIRESNVTIVPNGIVPRELPSKSQARAALGLDPSSMVIGFVGRMGWQKGPDLLLEAMPSVIAKAPEICFAMIGEGDMLNELKSRSRSLGIDRNIRWLGFQDGPMCMPAFDIFVLPSRYEGLPYVLLEALHAGIAIVASNQTGQRLLVDHGVNGYVYPFSESSELAQRLIQAALDPPRTEEMGRASKRKSVDFHLKEMAERTQAVYKQVLSTNHKSN